MESQRAFDPNRRSRTRPIRCVAACESYPTN